MGAYNDYRDISSYYYSAGSSKKACEKFEPKEDR